MASSVELCWRNLEIPIVSNFKVISWNFSEKLGVVKVVMLYAGHSLTFLFNKWEMIFLRKRGSDFGLYSMTLLRGDTVIHLELKENMLCVWKASSENTYSKSCACSITEGNIFQNTYSGNRNKKADTTDWNILLIFLKIKRHNFTAASCENWNII